jgi:uncharacterized membrane protein
MNGIFELLFKYRPLLYEKGTISFHPLWSPSLLWIALALALAGACWVYWKTKGVVPDSWRYRFTALRAGAFFVVVLLFSQPVLRLRSVVPQQNFVAVAYDLSKSMEIRDGAQGKSRLEIEQALLRPAGSRLLNDLAAKFKLRFFHFSNSAQHSESFQDMPRHGGGTDLEKSLDQIVTEMATVPLAGIVLVSDGADNRSADLDKAAARLRARNIPVYSVGVGSPDFPRDTEVLRVTAPRRVLKDTKIEAEVSVRSTGYPGRKSKIEVLDSDRVIQTQNITLGSDGEVKIYKVDFSSVSSGPRVFKFRVAPFPDEVVSENKDQSVLISVDDEQSSVLYVEGEPRWEYGFLRRAILEDKNLRLVTLLRQANGKFLRQGVESGSVLEKGFPTDKAELFRYKTVILGSVEASFFTFDQLRMIADFVSQRGGGFLMLGGKNSFGQGGYANTPIEDLLPVNIGRAAGGIQEFLELEYRIRLTDYGALHPIMRLSLSDEQNRKKWDSAPTLMGFNPTTGAKPGATILAQGSVPDSRGQSPVILAFQRFGRGKSVALTAANTWRWRMGLEHTDNLHQLFWKQMLRWLVSDVPDPVAVTTDRHSYSPEDSAGIQLEANDPSFLPLNDARATARIKAPSGQSTSLDLAWDVEKDGLYSAVFKPQEEGIYEISAEAFRGGKSLGTAKTNFRVAESTEEFHNANMNAGLLKRLSAETGGRYYSPEDTRVLAEDISYVEKGSSRMEEKDLWDMPFLFLLLTGLVSAEWFFRKRKGLA